MVRLIELPDQPAGVGNRNPGGDLIVGPEKKELMRRIGLALERLKFYR